MEKVKEEIMIKRMTQILHSIDKEEFVELYNKWLNTKYTVDDVNWE